MNSFTSLLSSMADNDNPEVRYVKQLTPKVHIYLTQRWK